MKTFIETRRIQGINYIDIHHSGVKPGKFRFNNASKTGFVVPDWYLKLPNSAFEQAQKALGPDAKITVVSQNFSGHVRYAVLAQANNFFSARDVEAI